MDSEVQIKKIVLDRLDRCAVCHREFHTDNIHVISRRPDMWTMLVECTDCHARNFVAAVMNDGDPNEAHLALRRLTEEAVGAMADEADVIATIDAPPPGPRVDAGDVVDIHQYLDEFDGDFVALFRGK
jgi:DNA-directed RNA polymerase subunit RPC12/RpoP